jgi:hypothetical protein
MHNTYGIAYTAINKMGFSEIEDARFNQLGVVCYKNTHIHVVLQNWDDGMSIESVGTECRVIRSLLMEMGANVWNAYYLLCSSSDDIDDDLAFYIERNSVSLRKYVLRQDVDLNRIPFLDDIMINEIDNPLSFTESINETDSIISVLLTEVKKTDGHKSNLNKTVIKDVVNFILSNEGKTV